MQTVNIVILKLKKVNSILVSSYCLEEKKHTVCKNQVQFIDIVQMYCTCIAWLFDLESYIFVNKQLQSLKVVDPICLPPDLNNYVALFHLWLRMVADVLLHGLT